MPRMSKIGSIATKIRQENGDTIVRYHATDVITFNTKRIILNSGGWRTVTTRNRINQAAHVYNLPVSVYQRDFNWYVTTGNGAEIEFTDGMSIPRNTTHNGMVAARTALRA